VAKFLFGLCNVQTLQVLREHFSSLSFSLPDKTKILSDFVLLFFPSATLSKVDYFQQVIQFCTWAYELNDERFASRIAQHLDTELRIVGKFLPNDVAPLHYVIRHRKKALHLDTTQFDTWFVGESLNLFLEEIPKTIEAAKISVSYETSFLLLSLTTVALLLHN